MTSILEKVSSRAMIREYAQGVAQKSIMPVADFIAPTVNVGNTVGKYKQYKSKSRLRIPDTKRSINGKATQIGFDAEDALYDCKPHALDFPCDQVLLNEEDGEAFFKEAIGECAEMGTLAHEKAVIEKALAELGAGTDINIKAADCDLVDALDEKITNIIKAAAYGSLMGVRILLGVNALRYLKNHKSVLAKFPGGGNATSKGVAPKVEDIMGLLLTNPQAKYSCMVHDVAPEGKDADLKFLLDNSIIIFAALDNPTRRDPSFMKTFRKRNEWMVPGSYEREDKRGEVAKLDWSCDVRVTNPAAGLLINLKTA